MSSNWTQQEKINNRIALIKSLDELLVGEQRSMRILRDQLAEHEVAMAERVDAGTDNARWTTWAENRLVGMQMQVEYALGRQEKTLGVIVQHEQEIKNLRTQIGETSGRRYVAVSSAPTDKQPAGFHGKTVMDLDRKGPGKKPSRRYVAKGERKKSAGAQQPAKKEKAAKAKNEKRGRKAA